jgi:hypothetical protein
MEGARALEGDWVVVDIAFRDAYHGRIGKVAWIDHDGDRVVEFLPDAYNQSSGDPDHRLWPHWAYFQPSSIRVVEPPPEVLATWLEDILEHS